MNLRIITQNHAGDPEKSFQQNRFQSRMAAQRPCRQRGSYRILIIQDVCQKTENKPILDNLIIIL